MASDKLARWTEQEAGPAPASRHRFPVFPPITALRPAILGRLMVPALLALLVWVHPALAAELRVPAGQDQLRQMLKTAAPGDRLLLQAGRHQGPLVLERPVTLSGEPGARIVGAGKGHVIVIDAPDVTVQGVEITGSGLSLESEDSGVFVTQKGGNARLIGNYLRNNLIGVFLKGPADALVRANRIEGRRDLRVNERGNGVQLWNTPGSVVEANDIRYGRDGIFVTTSKRNAFRDNHFQDLRFAVHYMYTHRSEISGNVSHGNHVGYAIMFSNDLEIRGNLSLGDRDGGLLFNYANRSDITDNQVNAAEKCVFIYNSNRNNFHGNRFQNCAIGIQFTAGSEKNVISGNAFVASRTQVKYVGTQQIEWSHAGRGNYWSDNLAIDLNSDGLADRPYRPNDMVDRLLWRVPQAKLLLSSPALQLLRWAQSEFPGLYPGGVTDSAPLMAPPMTGAPLLSGPAGAGAATHALTPPYHRGDAAQASTNQEVEK
jgi:nitrous oxidase accessory protein